MPTTVVLTNNGKGQTAKQVAGTTSLPPRYIGSGTGSHTAAAADTALTTEVDSRVTGTPTTVTTTQTNDTYQCTGTYTPGASRAIIEAGLFDAVSSGNMFVSATFDAINVTTADSISYTFKVQYS
jgi:hypothetical protein